MPHYNLPHNHGQNMERVLNKMPHTEDFTDIAFLFQQLGDPTRLRILWLLCHWDECPGCISSSADTKEKWHYIQPEGRKGSLLFFSRHATGKAAAPFHRCAV